MESNQQYQSWTIWNDIPTLSIMMASWPLATSLAILLLPSTINTRECHSATSNRTKVTVLVNFICITCYDDEIAIPAYDSEINTYCHRCIEMSASEEKEQRRRNLWLEWFPIYLYAFCKHGCCFRTSAAHAFLLFTDSPGRSFEQWKGLQKQREDWNHACTSGACLVYRNDWKLKLQSRLA